jgi:hypothetical protein
MHLTIDPTSFLLGILAVFIVLLLILIWDALKQACSRHHFGNLHITRTGTATASLPRRSHSVGGPRSSASSSPSSSQLSTFNSQPLP